MSDTTDFVNRLRDGDEISLMVEVEEGTKSIKGIVAKQWSNGTIFVGDFKLRSADYLIDDCVMAIRYSKGDSK